MTQSEIKSLKPTGMIAANVKCGLIMVSPMRLVYGCGELKPTREFVYNVDGYSGGLRSSVHLCEACEPIVDLLTEFERFISKRESA